MFYSYCSALVKKLHKNATTAQKARLATPGQSKLSSWLKAGDSMTGKLCDNLNVGLVYSSLPFTSHVEV